MQPVRHYDSFDPEVILNERNSLYEAAADIWQHIGRETAEFNLSIQFSHAFLLLVIDVILELSYYIFLGFNQNRIKMKWRML